MKGQHISPKTQAAIRAAVGNPRDIAKQFGLSLSVVYKNRRNMDQLHATDAKTSAKILNASAQSIAVADEAMRRIIALMKEVRDLRACLEVMRDAPSDCPRSWFVEQATRALEQEST